MSHDTFNWIKFNKKLTGFHPFAHFSTRYLSTVLTAHALCFTGLFFEIISNFETISFFNCNYCSLILNHLKMKRTPTSRGEFLNVFKFFEHSEIKKI